MCSSLHRCLIVSALMGDKCTLRNLGSSHPGPWRCKQPNVKQSLYPTIVVDTGATVRSSDLFRRDPNVVNLSLQSHIPLPVATPARIQSNSHSKLVGTIRSLGYVAIIWAILGTLSRQTTVLAMLGCHRSSGRRSVALNIVRKLQSCLAPKPREVRGSAENLAGNRRKRRARWIWVESLCRAFDYFGIQVPSRFRLACSTACT